jgi:hypothetical protein
MNDNDQKTQDLINTLNRFRSLRGSKPIPADLFGPDNKGMFEDDDSDQPASVRAPASPPVPLDSSVPSAKDINPNSTFPDDTPKPAGFLDKVKDVLGIADAGAAEIPFDLNAQGADTLKLRSQQNPKRPLPQAPTPDSQIASTAPSVEPELPLIPDSSRPTQNFPDLTSRAPASAQTSASTSPASATKHSSPKAALVTPQVPTPLTPTDPSSIEHLPERDRILSLLKNTEGNDAVKAARENAVRDDAIATMLGGLSKIGAGYAAKSAGSPVSVDNTYLDKFSQDAKDKVGQAVVDQKAKMQNLLEQYNLARQGKADDRAEAEYKHMAGRRGVTESRQDEEYQHELGRRGTLEQQNDQLKAASLAGINLSNGKLMDESEQRQVLKDKTSPESQLYQQMAIAQYPKIFSKDNVSSFSGMDLKSAGVKILDPNAHGMHPTIIHNVQDPATGKYGDMSYNPITGEKVFLGPNATNDKVENQKKNTELREKGLGIQAKAETRKADQFGEKQNSDNDKRLRDIMNNVIGKDEVMKKSLTTLAENKLTREYAEMGNPYADNHLPILLSRAATGSSRINKEEINRLGGSQALTTRATRAFQNLKSGTLDDEDRGFVLDLLDASDKTWTGIRDNRIGEISDKNNFGKISKKQIIDQYNGVRSLENNPLPSQATATTGPSPASVVPNSSNEMVDVINQEGKHGKIPKSRLDAALKSGKFTLAK